MISLCKNMWGYISEDIQERIVNYLENPTVENWDDIYSIIIQWDGITHTIWQWIIYCDPTFPKTGRATDIKGNVIKEWERTPTPKEVIRAINVATH